MNDTNTQHIFMYTKLNIIHVTRIPEPIPLTGAGVDTNYTAYFVIYCIRVLYCSVCVCVCAIVYTSLNYKLKKSVI